MEISRRSLLTGAATVATLACVAGGVAADGIATSEMPKEGIILHGDGEGQARTGGGGEGGAFGTGCANPKGAGAASAITCTNRRPTKPSSCSMSNGPARRPWMPTGRHLT